MIDFHPCCYQEIAQSNTRLGSDLAPDAYSALGKKECINTSAVMRPSIARLQACFATDNGYEHERNTLLKTETALSDSCLRRAVSKEVNGSVAESILFQNSGTAHMEQKRIGQN